ncbi:sigma-70 family RNA polymerase sigma factor [Aureibaculum sp. A20]|uniref:Sigma-70 family RNA polymerase sigma factor n=1 Tax=Aureibaculum flavum TaxID=2795986 RepID=A0ABS0WQG1_9FLAO|nr:sigma-70 family RNA polymerase sigma factor [Aureibaculum flavum]MBJ2174206.1 sigma-70 family RNA polymerase sigma factor [Aureibaculum flavum]
MNLNTNFEDNTYLIESLKQGDEKAYSHLIEKFHKKLFIYAFSLTNNKPLAKDVLQNVFLNVWIFRDKLDSNLSINNFLYTATYNEFIRQYWKNQSTKDLENKYAQALNEVINETDEKTIETLMSIVTQEIQNLPKKCKKVFLLSKEDGLTNMEISEYLEISIKTVEAHISKAYCIIRKKIGKKTSSILFLLFPNNKTS